MNTHAKILVSVIFLTVCLASFNTYEEEISGLINFIGPVVGAVFGSVICLLAYAQANKSLGEKSMAYLIAAYVSAILGLLAYLHYATNGKSDSLNSAAHMHIIAFPVLHTFLSVSGVFLATVWVSIRK
jgi:uncharacterized membrane protein YozB (DUF420 family)